MQKIFKILYFSEFKILILQLSILSSIHTAKILENSDL